MRRISLPLFMLLVLLQAAFAQQANAQTASRAPKHLAIALSFVQHLDLQNTDYEHGAPRVSFSTPYESHTDCSGFVDALLTHCYGVSETDFKSWFGSTRPSARRYHD